MAIRRPARLVAPLVLLVCAAAVLVIVQRTLSEEASPGKATPSTVQTQTTATRGPKTYRVRSGDTLGSIAEKVDVSVDTLVELNPDVDPQTLRAGQRLRLRE